METFKNNHEAREFEMQVPGQQNLEEHIWEIYNSEDKNPETDEILSQIAKQIGEIPTFERQYLDSQEFHDISVWKLCELLRVSYELGKSNSRNEAFTQAFEKVQEIYRQTYLELEIGDVVEFDRFSNFDLNYENIFEEENFKVRGKLNGEQTLEYSCQFKDFETAHNLYCQLDDVDGFNFRFLLNHLNEQEVENIDRTVN